MSGQSISPEMVRAMEVGVSAGEIATAEYVLEKFKGQMSPQLEDFLQKVLNSAYKKLEGEFDTPAEDIALEITSIFAK